MSKQPKKEAANQPRKRGPEPDRLKLEGDWEKLMGDALKKQRPASGWPKPDAMPQRSPKAKKK